MASLSNINGLFDVHSTGAILFSTSHGTSGQILRSNGNAAPTWVAASTVIGGPYLPLTGGTLTGATATATGISFTVGGTTNLSSTLTVVGVTTLANVGYLGDGLGSVQYTLQSANNGFGTIDFGDVADSNIGRLSYSHVDNSFLIRTNNATALTLDSSQNATFSGNVAINGSLLTLGSFNQFSGIDTSDLVLSVDKNNVGGGSSFDIQMDGATSAFYINNSRNVGIGTTSPNGKLTILEVQAANKGDFDFQQIVYNGGWSTNVDGLAAIQWSDGVGSSNTIGRIGVTYTGSQGEFQIKDLYYGGYGGSGKVFAVRGDGRAYFTGNVGIGTDDPGYTLDITAATPSLTLQTSTNANDPVITLKSNGPITSEGGQIWYRNSIGSLHLSTTYPATQSAIVFHTGTSTDQGTNNERMRITGDGNVGIGTTGPNVLLQLRSNINTIPANTDFAMRSGKSFRFLGDGDGNGDYGSYIEAPTKGIITIGTRWVGGDEGGLTVNRANVGIGTAGPEGKLNIETNAESNVPALGANTTFLKISNTGGAYGAMIGQLGSGNSYIQSQRFDGTATAYNLLLQPNGGNVGIGTTSPSAKLHVQSAGSTDVVFKLDNTNVADTAGAQIQLICDSAGSGDGNGALRHSIRSEFSGAINWEIHSGASHGDLNFSCLDSFAMIINSELDVGIGTTSPRAKLEVAGDITIQNGVYTYATSGTTTGTTNINFDITVGNEGGQGNVFKIEAGFAHYYAMNYNAVAEWWCTSRGTAVVNTYILNANTTFGGDWSASKPNTTTLRITKSAGTYVGAGKYWVKVTYVPF